ncbi:MAG TPA: acetyl-CoA carboxylase biotin carboxylase subunit [Pseudonocardiaceae bacterium]|nr:acetyl-CoA carboxylase biotin carboxylase subunit [Pseudonocardiaceae bacterium]
MFSKVLIANRGEIALRVARACREMGIRSIGVYSTADRDPRTLRHFDQVIHIGPAPGRRSYQNTAAVVEAALQAGADAVHPGYGFLSEDPDFAEVCASVGITFIGPRPEQMRMLGDKVTARTVMRDAGLTLLPGSVEPLASLTQARATSDAIGYPVIVKAVAGGGGKGMAVVRSAAQLPDAFARARSAARHLFGDDRVYLERCLTRGRHVEVQILCDSHGGAIHLGTRDCSVQRRHQKLLEEGPAPALDPVTVEAMTAASTRAARAIGFLGAGTVEFLVDEDERFYFMELNARIQVEHPVTEAITGVDLVREQIYIADGMPLGLSQQDITLRGVAVECRVNGEDPARDFAPTPGMIDRFDPPGGPFTRIDTHCFAGYLLSPYYDSLLAKVVVWAPDREQALNRMDRALTEFDVAGRTVRTTIPFLRRVISDPEFRKAEHSTALVDRIREHRS